MKCIRCSGLMVEDELVDLRESYLPMWMRALRCIACGNIEDPLIHQHRAVRQTRATKLAEVPPPPRILSQPPQAA